MGIVSALRVRTHPNGLVARARWVLVTLALAGGEPAPGAGWQQLPALSDPAGAVVYVSTEPELQRAVRALESNTTITIAPGTYQLTSTLKVTGPVANVTIRGASNDPADVVLVGRGMGNANVEDVPHGIATSGAVAVLTIANLTIRDVFAHAVMFDVGSEAPRIFNVVLANAGRQLIKTFADERGGGVDKGTVEYSTFEYTAPVESGEIGGLDVSAGFGWAVRANRFRNIQAAGQLAGPAVLMSRGSSNSVVEQNSFIDCQREIALGLENRTPNDHSGGIVRNNSITRKATIGGTTAILIADSPDSRVLHNTILANGTSKVLIEYRFADSTGIVVHNNLLDGEIQSRDGASGSVANNHAKATARMFVQPSSGDLHLVSAASEVIDRVPVVPEAGGDIDGDPRPHGAAADYGADESRGGSPATRASRLDRGSAEALADASRDPPLGAPLPAPWKVADVGDPASATTGSWWAGTFSVRGSGDIGGHSDQFGFVHRLLDGDGEIVARLEGFDGSGTAKSGVMIREELTGGAKYAAALLTADKRILFQRRIANDAVTSQTASLGPVGPWVRLLRRGQTLSAFSSLDGVRWVLAGSEIVYMNRLVYVGLAVTGRSSPAQASVHFTRVAVSMSAAAPNTAPIVSLSAPSSGATCQSPCTIPVTAAASDPDGTVARVDFYAGHALIGSATRSPFSVTWRAVPPGTHTLKAMAYDDLGAVTTSAGVVVTAKARMNDPPVVSIVAPAPEAAHTASTDVDVIAHASDADGTITRVEFFAGSTLIGIAKSSPYRVTWRSAPVGTYTLSAKAWDDAGGSMISAGVNITIAPASPLPPRWHTVDVGQPMVAGSASHRSATFSVTGAGVDVGERSDQFRFVYQPLDGDGEISACVASLDYVNSWSKAGVMVRESLAVDSRYAFSLLSAGWGVAFHYRSEAGARSVQAGVAPAVAPHCVRLVRKGGALTAYHSVDGTEWVSMGTATIAMSPSVFVGLAVTSHDVGRAARAAFGKVSASQGR